MTDLINLIWLTHPTAIKEVLDADFDEREDAAAFLMAMLYLDDTFSEYSEMQLQAAINEEINNY